MTDDQGAPREPDLDSDSHVTDYLIIERGVDDRGQFVRTRHNDGIHIAEALGMLEFAKMHLTHNYMNQGD